jgi:bacillithiol biosynthesis deacetylase BshB1
MSSPVDLLAIGAHPDDAEIGCGGVLAIASAAGMRVAVADLTDGELATHGTREQRKDESRRAAEIIGVRERVGLGLPDGRLGTESGHRDAVVGLIRELRPGIVLAPYPEDRHPDHAAAGEIGRAACFIAGLEKAGEGAPHRPAALYHYMLHHPFTPSFVVDVSAVWDRKMAVLAVYESQFGHAANVARTEIGSGRFLELLDARAAWHGAMIGAERGEAFHCPGPVGLATLPGLGHDRLEGQGAYRMFG